MAEDRMLSDEILLGIINSKSGGGGGGGLQYKTIKYTGTGTNPNVIDFGNDTPKEVLAIYQDPDYDIPNGVNYEGVMGWAWGFKLTQSIWSNRTGRDPNTSNGGNGLVRVTYNGNIATVTGGNAASCGNANECHYIVAYLV